MTPKTKSWRPVSFYPPLGMERIGQISDRMLLLYGTVLPRNESRDSFEKRPLLKQSTTPLKGHISLSTTRNGTNQTDFEPHGAPCSNGIPTATLYQSTQLKTLVDGIWDPQNRETPKRNPPEGTRRHSMHTVPNRITSQQQPQQPN